MYEMRGRPRVEMLDPAATALSTDLPKPLMMAICIDPLMVIREAKATATHVLVNATDF